MSAIPYPRPHLIQGGDQRSFYAAYLRARDVLLQIGTGAVTHSTALLRALNVGWAIRAARRTLGYLAARLSLARLMRIRGVASVVLWVILGTSGWIRGITKALGVVRSYITTAVSTAKAWIRGLVAKVLSRKGPEEEELEAAVVAQKPQNLQNPVTEANAVPARPVVPVVGSLNSQHRYPAKKAITRH